MSVEEKQQIKTEEGAELGLAGSKKSMYLDASLMEFEWPTARGRDAKARRRRRCRGAVVDEALDAASETCPDSPQTVADGFQLLAQ